MCRNPCFIDFAFQYSCHYLKSNEVEISKRKKETGFTGFHEALHGDLSGTWMRADSEPGLIPSPVSFQGPFPEPPP